MRLFNFIKNLFYDSELDFLNEKDIVWAKRYNNLEEKDKIEIGHQEGPYIIIHKSGKKVYALECGSNKNINTIQLLKVKYIRKYNYNLMKDGYIFIGKLVLLNKDRFIKKLGQIDDYDLNRIYKSIYLINKRYKNLKVKHFPKRKLKFYYEKGDIVLYQKQQFYITNIDENYYYVHQIHESKKGKITITINNISYSFNFASTKNIPKKEKLELLNITDKDIVKNIEEFTKREESKKKNTNKLNRGKLVLYNGEYFLIYEEKNKKLLTYKIYLSNDYSEDMYAITIRKGLYYTLLEKEELEISDDIKIVREASLLEMDQIKKIKKNIKVEQKQDIPKQKIIYKKYLPGYIMLDSETLDRYIILKRKYNTITFSPIDNIESYCEVNFDEISEFNYEVMEKMDKFRFNALLNDFYQIQKRISYKKNSDSTDEKEEMLDTIGTS